MTAPRMIAQELPPDVVAALQRARQLEALAAGLDQQRRAVAGTAALMLAAVDAGWRVATVARAAGLQPRTARARVRSARARYDETRPAIVIDEPLRACRPLDVLKQPVTDREWLSLPEAAEHTGRSLQSVRNWRRRGLLPHPGHRPHSDALPARRPGPGARRADIPPGPR